jgi:hypothetical protein
MLSLNANGRRIAPGTIHTYSAYTDKELRNLVIAHSPQRLLGWSPSVGTAMLNNFDVDVPGLGMHIRTVHAYIHM